MGKLISLSNSRVVGKVIPLMGKVIPGKVIQPSIVLMILIQSGILIQVIQIVVQT